MLSRLAAPVALAFVLVSPPCALAGGVTWFWPQQAHAVYAAYPDTAAGFLAALNAERARVGRPPLSWDAKAAAYAARNTGGHSPRSRYGNQCESGVRSYREALYGWMGSPEHRAILMGATRAVGCSRCPSGTTANAL